MLWVKKGTHVIDHPRFLQAGAIARDLYDWGMLYAGKHETDGEIPMVAVLASAWGAGGSANIRVATKLVDVGLWLRTDTGFLICRWTEQGNETKGTLDEKRKAGRERKAKSDARRNGVTHSVTPRVSNAKGSTSTSLSGSDLDLGSEIASELPTGVRERVVEPITELTSPPSWFAAAIAVIAMTTGIELPEGEAWLRYAGARHNNQRGIATSQPDAQQWLTTVMVKEVREAREKAARDRERDSKFDRDRRFAKEGPEKPPPPTKAQAQAFAEQLAARVRASRTAGGGQ